MHRHIFSVATIRVTAGRDKLIADVLVFLAARLENPAHADTITDIKLRNALASFGDSSNHFVTGDNRQHGRWRSTFDLIQLSVANTAGTDLNQDLVRCRFGSWNILKCQRCRIILQ